MAVVITVKLGLIYLVANSSCTYTVVALIVMSVVHYPALIVMSVVHILCVD
jgi:hypothetical protein